MNRLLVYLLPLITLLACNNSENSSVKAGPSSAFSTDMNQAIDSTLDQYFALSELFVNWDSTKIDLAVSNLQASMDHLSSRIDTASGENKNKFDKGKGYFNNAKTATRQMLAEPDLFTKRHSFHIVSDNMFHFLEAIRYDMNPVFLQECTMPFNDTGRGVWLSKTEEKRNPYLGLYHPYYKSGMLECGTLEEKIDFTIKTN
jgi:hypothetical protein